MPHTVSDHIVSILQEWGVDAVFGLPGDGINGLPFGAAGRLADKLTREPD
jgi:hypothetical protein